MHNFFQIFTPKVLLKLEFLIYIKHKAHGFYSLIMHNWVWSHMGIKSLIFKTN